MKQNFRNNYEILNRIGEGFGVIYEAKLKKTNEKRAIKIINKNQIKIPFKNENFREPTEEEIKPYIKCFYNQMDKMIKCMGENKQNENAVKIYEHYETKDEFAMVMELCDENILNLISNKDSKLTIEEIKEIVKQLNNTFKIIIENKIFLKYLRLENILLKYKNKEKTKFTIKLKLGENSDLLYQLRKKLSSSNRRTHYFTWFNAPEILKKEKYIEKCDLWSLGVVIYVLCFKEYPYKGDNKEKLLNDIKQKGQSFLRKTENSYLDNLIQKLLIEDPEKRINWEEYFSHPFFGNNKPINIPTNIKIKNDDYKKYYDLGKRIGEGGFASVFKIINKDTNEKMALKIIDKERIRTEYRKEYFREMSDEEMKNNIDCLINEITNMKLVEGKNKENENTVKLYDCFNTKDELSIVMELCDENILNLLTNKGSTFTIEEIKDCLNQLNNTFKIMNENNLVHRDLKLENILIKKENNKNIIKLSDYGVSKQLISISKKFSTRVGTINYTAPEILKGEKYDEKCDLWSLGIIIYVLCFKKYPYNGQNEIAILNQIKKLGQNILKKTDNNDLDDLLSKLLKENPNERITWKEYYNHPFLIKNNSNEYEIGGKIGEGAFASVFKAKIKGTNIERAIKIINKDKIINSFIASNLREPDEEEIQKYIDDFKNETNLMKIIEGKNKENKNTVKFYEYNEKDFSIVMELCDENLTNFIVKKKKSYNIKEIYELLTQLNNTFKIMNDNRIAHRDLKPDNILIKYENKEKTKYTYKISDYGISKQLISLSKQFSTNAGTLKYMAPEILKGEKFETKCDLWSLGVIIYSLLFTKFPYNGLTDLAIINQIKTDGQNCLQKTNNRDMDDLIKRLLTEDPKNRISWNDYFNHSFFKKKH